MGGLNPPVLPLSNLHRWHIWVLQINVITYANVQNKFSELIAAQTRAVRDVMNISCTDGDQDDLLSSMLVTQLKYCSLLYMWNPSSVSVSCT